MKVSLPLFCILAATSAFTPSNNKPLFGVDTIHIHTSTNIHRSTRTRLFYEVNHDPPNDSNHNVWSVLANTEKWMSSTLSTESPTGNGNPLSRKEVSYVCETSHDPAMIVANMFRKLKEFRQLGEQHGSNQEDAIDQDGKHERATLRQTQVLVIPSNDEMTLSFKEFDNLINAINQARRNARDYVTDVSLEKLDDRMYGEGDRDWSVSVNCAHLHPKFGEMTPEEELAELQNEEQDEEVDLNLQEYKERRLLARRSPYPSVVVEVRSMPPLEFSSSSSAEQQSSAGPQTPETIEEDDDDDDEEDDISMESDQEVTSDFVLQLEALFSKSAHMKDEVSNKKKDDFFDAIGNHIEEVSAVTPMMLAQTWIDQNDPLFEAPNCAFTASDTKHVDEAYEFVFTNMAMQTSQFLLDNSSSSTRSPVDSASDSDDSGAQKRQYLVMGNFVSSSATSLEKFTVEVNTIVNTISQLQGKMKVSCLHPEHVDATKRSPVPIFILQWTD